MTEKRIFSVSELTQKIKNRLENDFLPPHIMLSGEVSKPQFSGGHLYFTVKDSGAIMNCVMWRTSIASGLKFDIETGQKVVVTGDIKVYAPSGRYQLQAVRIEKEGVGNKFEELEKLKQKLMAEGMFDKEHKKPIPKYPKRIGIVTAKSGAVIDDICKVARDHNVYVNLILCPAKVQGEDAAITLIKGLKRLEELGVDIIIIGRGGGSMEDLWCFNDERLARAVYDCKIPVISGVGHEPDWTIIDGVADLRAATPTDAAKQAIPVLKDRLEELDYCKDRMRTGIQSKIDRLKHKLSDMELMIKKQSPQMKFKEMERKLDIYSVNFNKNIRDKIDSYDKYITVSRQNLGRMMRASYEASNRRYISLATELDGNSPMKRLLGGYSYIENEAGDNVNSIKKVKTGENLKLVLSDGSLKARVEEVSEKHG
ncbi:MAG: exodeoxyribonuclease VII large subunit [Catonella sp.]|uniref:exodeoxyribonuclease VII large subunit n=1 Tax=Catonella sp. TaxID=2382125 RepID=UPI003F9FB2DD